MSTEVEILGDGAFAGAAANIGSYSVTEYGSPVALTNTQSGVGSISFEVVDDDSFNGTLLLPSQRFRLDDPYAGQLEGIIDGLNSQNDTSVNVTASGALLPLVSQKSAPAMTGTLGLALIAYFALCGIDDGFQFDSDIAAIPVDLPSWTGDVWTQIKKLQAIHQFEIADVAGQILVRKLRLRQIDVQRYTNTTLDLGRADAAQIVEVYYYNNQWKTNAQVYPDPATSIVDRSIISVQASETTTTNVDAGMWISQIQQPTQVTSLPWNNTSVTSVYSVVDKDGQPVSVTDWRNGGGLVTFAIGADGKSVDVTVRGMSTNSRAPYRIASSSDDREYQYAALYIAATGVAFKKEMLWSATGASLEDAPADAKITIDEPLVGTRAQAQSVLTNAVMRAAGFSQTLEINATAVNRRGELGQVLYPTFAQFNATIPSTTFTTFNAAQAGKTFAQFTSAQAALVQGDFANQAFGGVAGSRVGHRYAMYRVRDARMSPGAVSFTAEYDTLFSDWEAEFSAASSVAVRTNYIRDPRFTNLTNWAIQGATRTVTDGVMDITVAGAVSANFLTPTPTAWFTPFVAGDMAAASYKVQNIGDVEVPVRVSVWDGSVYDFGPLYRIQPGETAIVSHVSPATGAYSQPRLHGAPPIGARMLVSEPILEKATQVGTYFYGGGASPVPGLFASWSGEENNSTSILTASPSFGGFNGMWGSKTFEQHARMPLFS